MKKQLHKWEKQKSSDISICVKCFCSKRPVYQVIAARYKKIVATSYTLRGVTTSKAPECIDAIVLEDSDILKALAL